jgi:hypothetical protein
MIQGRNNMQMLDVLKRLQELDANNPNIVKESQPVEECGPMGMMAPEPKTPATINITAGSGEELGSMLNAIMQLAGVHKVEPEHLGAEPPPAVVTTEPASGVGPMSADNDEMRSMIAAVDKLNPEKSDDEEETDESTYDNSPDEEVEGPNAFTDHGDLDKNPAGGGNTNDITPRSTFQPTATYESLMAEYKAFIGE